jgi:hypothetical protein
LREAAGRDSVQAAEELAQLDAAFTASIR